MAHTDSMTVQLASEMLCSRFSSELSRPVVGLGGRDNAVYVYPFMGHSLLSRLEGHTDAVTALDLDARRSRLVAGSDGGAVRMWDLNTEQTIRTFGTGHRSTVTGVDFHCCGDFIATCSRDTYLRIWDIRKKSSLQSYKGVSVELCVVEFCPSGRWVASGCAKGVVRLYDLTHGKILHEFEAHSGPITSINFHPVMYFLSVASADGAMSVWDLENYTLIFQSRALDTPLDSVRFFKDGVMTAADGALRVYGFSRMSDRVAKVIQSPWRMIGDLMYSPADNEAWYVETRGTTSSMGRIRLPSLRGLDQRDGHAEGDSSRIVEGAAATGSVPAASESQAHPLLSSPALEPRSIPVTEIWNPPHRSPSGIDAPMAVTTTSPPVNPTTAPAPLSPKMGEVPSAKVGVTSQPPTRIVKTRGGVVDYVVTKKTEQSSTTMSNSGSGAEAVSGTLGFTGASQRTAEAILGNTSDVESVVQVSPTIMSILHHRLTHLRVLRALWATNPLGALQHIKKVSADHADGGIVTDFLVCMQNQRMKEKLTLELMPDLMDIALTGLRSPSDYTCQASLRVIRSMNIKFRAQLDDLLRSRLYGGATAEARLERCQRVQRKLEEAGNVAMHLSNRSDTLGEEAGEVAAEVAAPWMRRQ